MPNTKITLPEFDDNQIDWEDFKDMFITVIHDNKTMPLVKKMHYLKGCLKGKAVRIISRIPLSAEGYESAWELIFKHYDNPQQRLENYLQCLFEAKPLIETSAKSINILNGYYRATQAFVWQILRIVFIYIL